VNIYDQRPDPYYGTGAIVERRQGRPDAKAGGKVEHIRDHREGIEPVVELNGVKDG
jgi:hypothetical protein